VGDYEASAKVITELEQTQRAQLRYILTTHHHWDHQGGNKRWKEERGDSLKVITGSTFVERYKGCTDIQMKDLQTMEIGDICICTMDTPGHTAEHVSYIVTHVTPQSTKTPLLFSGDTLFIGGCGRLLDPEHCTAETLFYSLQKMINLPNETLVMCGHEYTQANLKFAKYLEPDNPMIDHKLKQVEQALAQGDFTVPSKLMEERLYNPFIRCAREPYFKEITGENDPVRIFGKIRKLKDNFKI
jgi:hydroxyacylglutathione hydrolase